MKNKKKPLNGINVFHQPLSAGAFTCAVNSRLHSGRVEGEDGDDLWPADTAGSRS